MVFFLMGFRSRLAKRGDSIRNRPVRQIHMSYRIWKNISLNLTVLDEYNTEVAQGVEKNRFEIRSSLGYTF
jgi:hypothetical protein